MPDEKIHRQALKVTAKDASNISRRTRATCLRTNLQAQAQAVQRKMVHRETNRQRFPAAAPLSISSRWCPQVPRKKGRSASFYSHPSPARPGKEASSSSFQPTSSARLPLYSERGRRDPRRGA